LAGVDSTGVGMVGVLGCVAFTGATFAALLTAIALGNSLA